MLLPFGGIRAPYKYTLQDMRISTSGALDLEGIGKRAGHLRNLKTAESTERSFLFVSLTPIDFSENRISPYTCNKLLALHLIQESLHKSFFVLTFSWVGGGEGLAIWALPFVTAMIIKGE